MYEQTRQAQHRWDAMELPDLGLSGAQERRLVKLAPHLAPDFDSFQDFVRAVADELGTGLDLTDDSRVLAAWQDAHPDHVAGTRIVEDARFDAKLTKTALPGAPVHVKWLFHYYATHLRIIPQPSFLMDTTGFAARKRDAVLAYRSQFVVNERNRRVVEWLDAAGTYFGSRIGTETAEPFFAREPIGLGSLDFLA